jgi:hypothetical protein
MSLTLESARELYGATEQDQNGLYFSKKVGQDPRYFYTSNGKQICFTCGNALMWGEVHTACGMIEA